MNKNLNVRDIEVFLDWLVLLDIRHYPTDGAPGYEPTGLSHFYLNRSPERFTSLEIINIWNHTADAGLNKRWLFAVADSKRK